MQHSYIKLGAFLVFFFVCMLFTIKQFSNPMYKQGLRQSAEIMTRNVR